MFKRMRIGTKLFLGFGLVVALAIALGMMAIWQMRQIQAKSHELSVQTLPELSHAANITHDVLMGAYNWLAFGLAYEEQAAKTGAEYHRKARESIAKLSELAKSFNDTQMAALVEQAGKNMEDYRIAAEATVGAVQRRGQMLTATRQAGRLVETETDKLLTENNQLMTRELGDDFVYTNAAARQDRLRERLDKITNLNLILDTTSTIRRAVLNAMLERNTGELTAALGNIAKVRQALEAVKATTRQEQNLQQIANIDAALKAYETNANGLTEALQELDTLRTQRVAAYNQALVAVGEVSKKANQAGEADIDNVVAMVRQSTGLMSVGLVIAMVTALVIAYLITRIIVTPAKAMMDRIKDIAQGEGDLTKRIALHAQHCSDMMKCGKTDCPAFGKATHCWEEVGSEVTDKADIHCPKIITGEYKSCHQCKVMQRAMGDELGILGGWFNTFVIKVHGIIVQVAQATQEVASAATQIASSSEEMAAGMKQQTEQVTQISAAMEQMSQSVVEVARKSGDAASNASEAGKTAEAGGTVVRETITGMEAIAGAVNSGADSVSELGKRSEQIGQIVAVINDIADQTNLLALNAAIEAARAGEHGRGFAVVADEVRKLADRTTKATEEIAQSIRAIQSGTQEAVGRMNSGTEQVTLGVQKATRAGESLDQIVTAARGVADMIRSIAAAAEEQSAASEQISRNVESVSAVIKQANEGAEQAAAAATQLSRKAEELQRMVGQFKLDEKERQKAA